MEPHLSVVRLTKEGEKRDRAYLRMSTPNIKPFDRELSAYDIMTLITKLSEQLKTEMEYKNYEYEHSEDE